MGILGKKKSKSCLLVLYPIHQRYTGHSLSIFDRSSRLHSCLNVAKRSAWWVV